MQQDAISAFRKNLNDLEEIVMQAKRVPLSNMCMVDRERILGLANAITTDLPTVFAECEGVVQNQITIISEANERAEELANVAPGAAAMVTSADGKALGAAVLGQSGAPELDSSTGQAMQSLSFLPMDDGAWMGVGAGDRVVVELVQEALEDQALVPISAVDSRNRVWFVEDGIATPVEIDLTLRNDAYVAVPQEWAGKRVVLLPETASLYPGCAVKEARAR